MKESSELRRPFDESLRMSDVGGGEDLPSLLANAIGQAVVDDGGGEESQGAVVVVIVVPGEEHVAEGTSVLDGPEAVWEAGPVLHGLELGFGEGIVVGDLGTAVGLDHSEICEQQGHGLAFHGGASVGVKRELPFDDSLLVVGLADEALGQGRTLVGSHHPADHVAAEDVEDHVEVEVGPLRRTHQLGDVPAPDFVRAGGQELGLGVVGATDLVPAFLHLLGRVENAVQRGPRQTESTAGRGCSHTRYYLFHGGHQSSSSLSNGFRGIPRSSCTFFWNAMMASAFCRRRSSRRFSCSSFLTLGSTVAAFRPRFFGVSPSSRPRRQLTRCEEYSPSFLRSSPI